MTTNSKSRGGQGGFTLTELLIVIVVMGILAGVVVFAMSGVTSHAQSSACTTEKQTIGTAEDAYFANPVNKSQYGDQNALVAGGYLKSLPQDYTVKPTNNPANYTIKAINNNPNKCS